MMKARTRRATHRRTAKLTSLGSWQTQLWFPLESISKKKYMGQKAKDTSVSAVYLLGSSRAGLLKC
eukprot:5352255-Amphidinium_carterae.1